MTWPTLPAARKPQSINSGKSLLRSLLLFFFSFRSFYLNHVKPFIPILLDVESLKSEDSFDISEVILLCKKTHHRFGYLQSELFRCKICQAVEHQPLSFRFPSSMASGYPVGKFHLWTKIRHARPDQVTFWSATCEQLKSMQFPSYGRLKVAI